MSESQRYYPPVPTYDLLASEFLAKKVGHGVHIGLESIALGFAGEANIIGRDNTMLIWEILMNLFKSPRIERRLVFFWERSDVRQGAVRCNIQLHIRPLNILRDLVGPYLVWYLVLVYRVVGEMR